MTAEGQTRRQGIRSLDEQYPGISVRLTNDDRIELDLALSIDGVVTSRGLLAKVEPTSEIHILPAFGGG